MGCVTPWYCAVTVVLVLHAMCPGLVLAPAAPESCGRFGTPGTGDGPGTTAIATVALAVLLAMNARLHWKTVAWSHTSAKREEMWLRSCCMCNVGTCAGMACTSVRRSHGQNRRCEGTRRQLAAAGFHTAAGCRTRHCGRLEDDAAAARDRRMTTWADAPSIDQMGTSMMVLWCPRA